MVAKKPGKHRPTSAEPSAPTDGVSRRGLLGFGLASAGVAAVGSVAATDAVADTPAWPANPANTTLSRTLLHGPAVNSLGYRKVVTGPGEPTMVRSDLLGGAARGNGSRNALLALVQFTDMHVIDAQSPARVEFLDRLNDPGNPGSSSFPFDASYRPQEMLTAHVAESMVQAVRNLSAAPVTGRAFDFAITTGDNADNTQYNELRWQIDILDGGKTIRPDSGNLAKWEGVGGKDDYDTSYWHPNGTPLLGQPDNYRAKYGFPTVPGLHDKCRAPFTSTGLQMPWYSTFGNHDGLVQGNAPQPELFRAIAMGKVKVVGLPLGVDLNALLAQVAAGDATALLTLLTAGPAKLVTADPNRKGLTRPQTVAEHFNTSGLPIGHGYTQDNVSNGTAHYTFDQGDVHCIVLDTVNELGYSEGSLDKAQFQWLKAELIANSSRYLDASGNWVAGGGNDRLISIFSHHTIDTMTNPLGVNTVNGAAVQSLLLQFPNVVAWINGHTHVNSVTPHARPSGPLAGSGFWEINTASHVDWPQQNRIIEIVNNGDGTLSIFSTIIDHAAPADWNPNLLTPLDLAALSRELGINDPQRQAETATRDGRRGVLGDRNIEMLVKAPF